MNQFFQEDLAITASFHVGCNSVSFNPFSFKNPNYYGEKLTERWIAGFHSAILRTAHADNEISLIIPMSLLTYSFAILMRFVGLKFRLPELALATAPFLVFSLAGYSFFDFEKKSKINCQELDYVYNAPHGKTTYLHPHLGILFSCRSVLYASTASLLIFAFLLNRTSEIGQLVIFCCSGFLISSSIKPCFFLLLLFFLIYFVFKPKEFPLRAFLAFLAGSIINISRLSFTIINKPQWNDLTLNGVFFPSCVYWYNTLGFFVPFAVLGVIFTKQIEGRITKSLLILFIFAANTSFYDNVTINIYTYYGLFMPMAVLSYLIFFNRFANFFDEEESKGIIGAVATLIAGAGCFSSVIGTSKMIKISETVYSKNQIDLYSYLLNTTNHNDIIFTTNSSLDVASTMLGRQVIRCSQDFMKLLGIELKYQKQISDFFFQPDGFNNYLKFVDYFLIQASDVEKFHFNVTQGSSLKNVYNISDVMIYRRNK
ncbi:hypothetical protein TVAG_131290 [Trichomonas vaginalis G3]|uniref:Mannosyltransferase n=1 Tax=Trichomonas vaginalis (strain ATCC PRA-98 / G3) TaxID=412133 RepID=A2EPQ2_TRIV3|nr:hypothetical protein TVAGG3_0603550 [Trichomonas vaginalis G3]EAY05395.1 hypothetical protein TVAG_131290 [Trichomonas vaginalis G3]KAI5524084.1 hypothetical protein TVAGG3_0603550 [Trichomonas vaginalis G3]|eukprot:XP_001317618.1 hypothetical protein [Trichomonas vaginalis G3]